MIQKHIKLLSILALYLTCHTINTKLTTLKHFDPSPNYSANNSMMPPNSHFLDLAQARIKGEQPSKRRVLGFNISGFIQKAVRARGYNGNTEYGSVAGIPPSAFELGDFRGTLYPMGLFLGFNPQTGYNIWGSNNVKDPNDTGDPADITCTTIQNFGLKECLTEIALGLSGNTASPCAYEPTEALVFLPAGTTGGSIGTPLGISIFNEHKLAQDTTYFGAFSLPLEYQQAGVKLEMNVNCSDYISLTIQGGISNMKQSYVNTVLAASSGTSGTNNGQSSIGPYSISAIQNGASTPMALSPLYNQLNTAESSSPSTTPSSTAQSIFNTYISNNIAKILDPDCLGSDPLCAFDDYSLDDIKLILSFKGIYEPFRYRHEEDDDAGSWPDMIFVPYAWVGGSFPIAKETDYSNILSLPFGNNGHVSVGGAIGMTFDFAESVEVGVESGVTYFLKHEEIRPFPTHKLQRILYPFEAKVITQPGLNWHFRALLNAYQFMKHCNFWMTYELIEHKKDGFDICDKQLAQYYVPEVLTCRSDWRSQMLNMGLSFDISPGVQASLVWQQPVSPRNAYYPVSILGSINFMF